MATTKKSRRRRRHRRHGQRAAPAAGSSAFRLLVGATVVGGRELARRLEAAKAAPRASRAGESPSPERETRVQKAGYLAVGVAAESLTRAGRAGRALARRGGDLIAAVDAVTRLPIIRTGARPAKAAVRKGRSAARALVARGRYETREGAALFTLLVEETTTSSVRDIAETAVKEVTHSREVAALVRAQSTGVLTDTILEVRANSEQADDRLERRVRSWLHRGGSGNGKGPDSAAPAELSSGERPA